MPTKPEIAVGFSAAAVALELYFLYADSRGLLFMQHSLQLETLNMPGGCLVTPHNPILELVVLGTIITGFVRLLRPIIDLSR